MKKLKLSIFLVVAIISAVLYSCSKDDFSESDAMKLQAQLDKQRAQDQDTLSTSTYRVSYTVNLVDASTSALKSASLTSAISGATVKFIQGDTVITKTADASGIVAIGNVKPGLANVNITQTGYSEVNYTVNLSSTSISGGREFSNIIPLIPVTGATATITGTVTYEGDLTNKTVETVPAGTQIFAMVRTSSAALPSTGSNGIVSISYDKLSLQAVTNANGVYTLTVPATVNGLMYDIKVSDFNVNQKLLQSTYFNSDTTGVLSILTNFGSSYTTASSVSSVNPVIVTVGAPDYTFTPAAATAVVLNNNGIEYVQDYNVGSSYAKSNTFNIVIDNPASASGGTKATLQLVINSAGHAHGSITAQGSKYPANFDASNYTVNYIKTPAKAVVDGVNGSGAITSYHVNAARAGEFYSIDNVQFVKHTGAGTVSLTGTQLPGYSNSGSSLNWSSTVVNLATAAGSGFVVGDSLVLSTIGTSDLYVGKLFMTTGSVNAINVTNEGLSYVSGQVDVIIDSPANGGTTATATATVFNGKISLITITNPGTTYTTPPAVKIVNKMEKLQAKFTATVSGGKISGFSPASSGKGYLAVPSVTISSAIPGQGSGASAYATVTGGVVSLTLVNQGSGYTGNNPASARNFSGSTTLTVTGSSTIINNIDLGTGKRTIEQ